ncbi:MAG: acyl-CoA dehydrogenase N-terminal domain-containing protein, partial [Spirochaetes bacterium]|nr:acyl-CoA dehydrogenase N-terminal domain-containing protein [Spirochaetota bacterium]
MALNPLVDSRDLRFTLFELLEVDKLTALPRYADFDRGMFEDVLDLAEKIAVEQLYPVSAESEKQGVKYDPATKKV